MKNHHLEFNLIFNLHLSDTTVCVLVIHQFSKMQTQVLPKHQIR